ncbi:MAG: glycosyltransferase family 4 protein [Desulfovibrionales bacterium]|nr:MAG: glycosyltransferase family 4 protein [Desulfovibrionales bacterium]
MPVFHGPPVFLALLFVAVIVSAVTTAYLASGRARLRILDHPNERSLHYAPVPRTGGLAILAGLVAALASVTVVELGGLHPQTTPLAEASAANILRGLRWPLAALLLVAVVSFIDDQRGLGAGPRFVVHLLAAVLALVGGLALAVLDLGIWNPALPGIVGGLFSVLFLIWMTNLYNFMDGMDGFAGGMGVIGFGFLGLFGWMGGEYGYALLCWCTSLACLGFLIFNFPPARIFMGDCGASTLGFWAGVLILWADVRGVVPLWAGVLVFSPFIVDATVTLLRRLLAGEAIWQAHRSHYYQRLVQLGWGHRKTVLAEYTVMLAAGLSGLMLLWFTDPRWVLPGLLLWGGIYLALGVMVGRLERWRA